MIITAVVGVCLVIIYILPHYTNKFYYFAPASITDSDISIAKGLFAAINVFFILAWLLASAFNKASISDMDMDPEDDYDGLDDT
jgi:hypothetical protein